MAFDQKDIDENKIVAAIGYLSLLCFVPLLGAKDSAYAQMHGRQGLALAVYGISIFIFSFTLGLIPFFGWLSTVILSLSWFVFVVIGIVNALSGQTWEVPVIGKYFQNVNL